MKLQITILSFLFLGITGCYESPPDFYCLDTHPEYFRAIKGVCADDPSNYCINGTELDLKSIKSWEPVEVNCDGIDNDCDGAIDEDLTFSEELKGVCTTQEYQCLGAQGWLAIETVSSFEESELSCDGLDNDCDGQVDEDLTAPLSTFREGVCQELKQVCRGTDGWIEPEKENITFFEIEETLCDSLDNDCDGQVDEGQVEVCDDQRDNDCDGIIDENTGEACDGQDNDCDGQVDEELPPILNDEQQGLCLGTQKICSGEQGWINYYDSNVIEDVETICDGLDNDCDGLVDEALTSPIDTSLDGVCEDLRSTCEGEQGWILADPNTLSNYESTETSCDSLDNDCDGQVDEGRNEVCDNLDNDCDGQIDEMESENCDGLDNDCDGQIDENLTAPPATLSIGVCLGSVKVCLGNQGWNDPLFSTLDHYEQTELTCDGLDNDCDGQVDENLNYQQAYLQEGVCSQIIPICQGTQGWSLPTPDTIANYEEDESLCDGLDNDCDGQVDENLPQRLAEIQLGVCEGALKKCTNGRWVEPNYNLIEHYQEPEQTCGDELDNDCDGELDEGVLCAPCSPNCPNIDWIAIESGTFNMGSSLASDEQPLHQVSIEDRLHVTRSEITVAQYEVCVNANICNADAMDSTNCTWNESEPLRSQLPINCVSRSQVLAFSTWVGGRLPSEAEWEYIARSRGNREPYPWGESPQPNCEYAQFTNSALSGCELNRPDMVCSHPLGNTIEDVCDMAGNVSEWTLDLYTNNYENAPLDGSPNCIECFNAGNFVTRGGSWLTGGGTLRVADRNQANSETNSPQIGFRLVY